MYHIVLYDLNNGIERLESIALDKTPTDKEVQDAVKLYGAKRFEVISK
ncbi:MAG: hypothetical protein ACQEXX_01665 [Bacillota bacterium]